MVMKQCFIILWVLHSHNHEKYTCGNKINNNDERTHFFRKIYLLHLIRNGCERVMCERWVGDWTNYNIFTPSSFVFSSTSFSFCRAAQSEVLRARSPLLGAGSLYSILSDSSWLNFLSHRVISLFVVHVLLVSVASAPNSTHPQSRLYPDIFDLIQLLLDWWLGRRSICYMSSRIGA